MGLKFQPISFLLLFCALNWIKLARKVFPGIEFSKGCKTNAKWSFFLSVVTPALRDVQASIKSKELLIFLSKHCFLCFTVLTPNGSSLNCLDYGGATAR